MAERYLIDSNVFIQGKNFHYRFGFCSGFWEWVEVGHAQDCLFSVDKVRLELLEGHKEDPVRIWTEKLPGTFFVPDIADAKVMAAYGEVIEWANKNQHYSPKAIEDFAAEKRADAFLIATGKAHGYTIATHERANSEMKRRIPIPDAASALHVQTVSIYDLLSDRAHKCFTFK